MATKELKELVAFGLTAAELVESFLDGVSILDVPKVIQTGVAAASGIPGAKEALVEYANMTDAEALELEAFVQEEFDIADENLEVAIEGALGLVIKLHELAKLFIK